MLNLKLGFGNWDLFGSIGIIGSIGIFSISLVYADVTTSMWNVKKSDHFIVYYQDAQVRYIDELAGRAEKYYDDITGELGFTRFENFWTWERRAKIYIYNTKDGYLKATGKAEWSSAHANVLTREIHAYADMNDFFDIILPHELGHIIFREFIGYRRRLPLWLDEGVVSYLEKRYRRERMEAVRELAKTEYFIPLERLEGLQEKPEIVQKVFYYEAVSVIEFLIGLYGRDKFTEFCQRLRDLRDDQDWFAAAREAYGFRDLGEMGEAWRKWLKQ